MMTIRLLTGDCRDVLPTLDAGSVQCVVTSPPYFGLRDYGVVGQIGLESSLDAFVENLVDVFRAVRSVLRDDGTLWLNLGDSYANDTKWGGSTGGKHVSALHGNGIIGRERKRTGLKSKDLMMVPALVALALQADGWYLRSDIIWSKKAPMPEPTTDRPTSAHEHVFLLSKCPRYYYDAEAVREQSDPTQVAHNLKYAKPYAAYDNRAATTGQPGNVNNVGIHARPGNGGRNLRNVWHLGPEPFPLAHFATFPTEIPRRCILAGTSEKGCCPACGAPWARTVERTPVKPFGSGDFLIGKQREWKRSSHTGPNDNGDYVPPKTTGWQPSCQCDAGPPQSCTVLDPFAGAGTTGLVADRLGRDAVLIELNPTYSAMIQQRITGDAPMFAKVEVA